MSSEYSAPALEKGIAILQTLADTRTPLSLKEIAERLERSTGEIFRMLSVLDRERLVLREAGTGRYRLGLRLFSLAATIAPYDLIRNLAAAPMREFSLEASESCHLSVLEAGRLVVLAEQLGSDPVRLSVPAGSVHDPRATLSGRLLLGALDEVAHKAELALAVRHFGRRKSAPKRRIRPVSAGRVVLARNESRKGVQDRAAWCQVGSLPPFAIASTSFYDRGAGASRTAVCFGTLIGQVLSSG